MFDVSGRHRAELPIIVREKSMPASEAATRVGIVILASWSACRSAAGCPA